MKKNIVLNISFLVLNYYCVAQPGTWTWMHGDSTMNSAGNYGTQGIPSPNNKPPALYEAAEFRDLQGNFWLYGGRAINGVYGDLWKYDPVINQWTWMKGNGLVNDLGNYGLQGVPLLSNLPRARGYGAASWVDLNGDFWIYGGFTNVGSINDLWKYNIATNIWTWEHGSSLPGQSATYGTLGVPYVGNTPGSRSEINAAWVDNSNNLWLFGGGNANAPLNDLWKYDTQTDEWEWVKGANFTGQTGVYGTKGVPDTSNVPGARFPFCHWKDQNGNFWFFGGGSTTVNVFNDMWMYNPGTNIWTWMSGANTINDNGNYGIKCIPSISNLPPARFENRCFWTDNKGDFWLYGGGVGSNFQSIYSDLWMFNPITLEWTFVSGDNLTNQNPVYGSIGIPAMSNKPGGRAGTIGWYNDTGYLFLFGGSVNGWWTFGNDLWRYEIDTICPSITTLIPGISFACSDTLFCEKQCINFFDLSTNNPTSWQWSFPGADSTSSTLQNPTNICYNNYGSYDVTLIACNVSGCDTLTFLNFITEFQNSVDSIWGLSDTLWSLPFLSYQWYLVGSGAIAGASNQYYVPTQLGSYYCVADDSIGCVATSNTIVLTAIQSAIANSQFAIFPNPNNGNFEIVLSEMCNSSFGGKCGLRITNTLGEVVFQSEIQKQKLIIQSSFTDGIYFLELTSNNKTFHGKFIVKQ